jgi:outer membrane protein assembly factor BamB
MPVQIFFCYAHEDEALLNKLKTHLRSLQREGLIDVWHDRDINAGTKWEQKITDQLNAAQIILLLISPDFIDSDYCYNIEMKRALERNDRGEATVIPVILRHVYWQGKPLGQLQALPKDGIPITDPNWDNLDVAFCNVTEGIRKAAEELIHSNPGETMQNVPINTTEISPEPTPPLRSENSSSAHRNRSVQGRKIFLGLLVGLILVGGIGTLLIRGGFSRSNQPHSQVTATAQATPRPTTTPHGVSNYDAAVAKSGVQFGFDAQHTHTNPYERTLNSSNVKNLKEVWTFQTGDAIYSSPTVANGMVYIGSRKGNLYAFKADGCGEMTCMPSWTAQVGYQVDSSPAVVNNTVYFGADDKNLHAFDAQTGGELWSAPTGGYDSSPVVAGGVVYIGSDDGRLHAFDAKTGVEKWSVQVQVGVGYVFSPAVEKNMVYVGSHDHRLYAFNVDNCNKRSCSPQWSAPTDDYIQASPTVANGVVYVSSHNQKLYAFNAQTGTKLWSTPTGDSIFSSPTVANDVIYVGSDDKKLYAFNAKTGEGIWFYPTDGSIHSSPAVANGMVYIGSDDGELHVFHL